MCVSGKKAHDDNFELESFDARSRAHMEVSTLRRKLSLCPATARFLRPPQLSPVGCAAAGAGGDASPLEWETRGSWRVERCGLSSLSALKMEF